MNIFFKKKEMVKEFTKTIRKLQREFQREINKLEMNNKKIQNELTRMVQKKEPRVFNYSNDLLLCLIISEQFLERNENCRTKYSEKQ